MIWDVCLLLCITVYFSNNSSIIHFSAAHLCISNTYVVVSTTLLDALRPRHVIASLKLRISTRSIGGDYSWYYNYLQHTEHINLQWRCYKNGFISVYGWNLPQTVGAKAMLMHNLVASNYQLSITNTWVNPVCWPQAQKAITWPKWLLWTDVSVQFLFSCSNKSFFSNMSSQTFPQLSFTSVFTLRSLPHYPLNRRINHTVVCAA